MKNHKMGLLSPSYRFALVFGSKQAATANQKAISHDYFHRLLLVCTVLIALTAAPCRATNLDAPAACAQLDKDANSWSVTAHLKCSLGDGAIVTVDRWYVDLSGFEGFSDAVYASGNSVTFSLHGPTSSLPLDAELALITVTDPDCGGTSQWLVRTDGGGSIVMMDEL